MNANVSNSVPSLDSPVVVLTPPPISSSPKGQGRRVLITVCVHGNEPCGWNALKQLSAEHYFNDDFWKSHPGISSLTMVLANPNATRENKRFVDANLNRLFDVEHEHQGYEHSLLETLQQNIDCSDWYMDLHSTSASSEPFCIAVENTVSQSVAECMPVTFVLEDLLESLEGTTMHWACRNQGRVAIVVECGQHASPAAVAVAKECIQEFLHLASFPARSLQKPPEPSTKSIVLTCHDCQPVHAGFKYVSDQVPRPFSHVHYNDLIAVDSTGEIRCHFPEGAFLIMPTAHSIVGEEAWFWGRPKTSQDASSLHGRYNSL